jgi:poly-gamma-glutamate synthesis protein (capsule biosynthesis protein)
MVFDLLKLPALLLCLCILILSACALKPVYVLIDRGDSSGRGLPAAAEFLEALLTEGDELPSLGLHLIGPGLGGAEGGSPAAVPAITIELRSGWEADLFPGGAAPESGAPASGESFAVFRTYLIPRTRVPEARRDTTLEACREGEEDLVALGELAPPFTGLRVTGLSAGDEGYPLVWVVRAQVRLPGERRKPKEQNRLEALGTALEGLLRERLGAVPNPLLETRPRILWLAAAGDLMLGRGAGDILLGEGPEGIFGGTAALIAGADLAIVNLEGAVSGRGSPVEKAYNFRFPPVMAGALRDAGIDAVLLANNHACDFGPDAFLDTLTHLEAAGIGILGAGRDREASAAPFVFGAGALPVHAFGIASFPREASGWDGLSVAAGEHKPGILRAERGGADTLKEQFSAEALDVVFFHGGNEWTVSPDARTRALYTGLIAAGADIVIGSHPHIVQGFEWVQGKPVFWSLGNFVFAGMEHTGGGDRGLFVRLGFRGTSLVYIEPYPLALSGPRTTIAPMEELKTFYALSKE